MSLRTLLVPIALVGALTTPASALDRGPSTPEERARVVKLAEAAGKDPSAVPASDVKWFGEWIEAVPDIMFGGEAPARWCMTAAKGDLRKVIRFHYEVSGVAYQIQHQIFVPKTLEEKTAIQQAAVEGVLRAYSALLAKAPENRSEKMDEALALQAKGEFAAWVKGLMSGKR